MQASTEIKEFIKSHEGLKLEPYTCVGGYCTIGYGHVIKKDQAPSRITLEQAEVYFEQDVAKAEQAVRRYVNQKLEQNQFDAIVSFTFNLGPGTLQRSTLRRKLNAGDYAEAPAEIKKYVYAGGRKWAGLIKRRDNEARLFSLNTTSPFGEEAT